MSPSVSVRLLLTQSDARLVELAREGHERAFEALVQRYRRALLNYCRRLLLPSERAEDALQQGLLRAWLALQDGCEVRAAKPWLYRIVHNAALDMLRISGYDYTKLSETLCGAGAPDEDLERRIAVREALAGLAALPELQREALLRTAVDGHSHEQVAHALGLSEGALRGLVYRARAALRAATTAFTPSPVLHWALSAHRVAGAAPLSARLAELGAGGGSVGVGGLLLKGGAAVVTAGALAGGIVAVHPHTHRPSRATQLAADLPSPATGVSDVNLLSDPIEGMQTSDAGRTGLAAGREQGSRPNRDLPLASGRDLRSSNAGEAGGGPSGDTKASSGDGGLGSGPGDTSSGSGSIGGSGSGSLGGSGSGDSLSGTGSTDSGSGTSTGGSTSNTGSDSGTNTGSGGSTSNTGSGDSGTSTSTSGSSSLDGSGSGSGSGTSLSSDPTSDGGLMTSALPEASSDSPPAPAQPGS